MNISIAAATKLCINNNNDIQYSIINTNTDNNMHLCSFVFTGKSDYSSNNQSIVFVHGANSYPTYWFSVVPLLVQSGFIVHCIALPGFGLNRLTIDINTVNSEQLLAYYIIYINEYINHITNHYPTKNSKQPLLVAHSFGGNIASAYVCEYDNCSGIIISNSAIFQIVGNTTLYWGLFFKYINPLYHYIQYWIFNYLPSILSTPILPIQPHDTNIGPYIISKFIYFNGYYSKLNCNRFHYMLGSCNTPISMIWGTDDTIVPLYTANIVSLSGSTENIKIVAIDNGGHNPIYVNGGKDYAEAIIECSTNTHTLKKLPKETIIQIKKITDNVYGTWNITYTQKQIDTMCKDITELIHQ